ncbi:hypothetical protein CVT26_006273 [Gymnopilus dilepis]|uniref:Uncharacterized protein n=1 Tax=Gymnopilus dilepis TaxID=231916 RepID=A0A409Y158_9AGAR|nr:hypothetical protein CVT26_006273 [Gymnopilus dilepis]
MNVGDCGVEVLDNILEKESTPDNWFWKEKLRLLIASKLPTSPAAQQPIMFDDLPTPSHWHRSFGSQAGKKRT